MAKSTMTGKATVEFNGQRWELMVRDITMTQELAARLRIKLEGIVVPIQGQDSLLYGVPVDAKKEIEPIPETDKPPGKIRLIYLED